MGFNFRGVDRDQLWLLPPSVAEWLPPDHLSWFVIDIVDELDLSGFLASYRADGKGGGAYHPAVMLAVLIYAYMVGERSSRRIERRCVEDLGFKVVAANQCPDHATIARFRATHEAAITGLFAQVLAVCDKMGLLASRVVAIDGTKLAGNASRDANMTTEELAAQILAEAADLDYAEDDVAADGPGGSTGLGERGGVRLHRMRELLAEVEAEAAQRSYAAHMARRAEQEARTGRPVQGRRPAPASVTHRGPRQVNMTDPDSRLLSTKRGFVQGYNAQAVVNTAQVVVAAEVTNDAKDSTWFHPMLSAATTNLTGLGRQAPITRVLADAGYWAEENIDVPGVDVLIAPGRARRLPQISATQTQHDQVLTLVEHGELDKAAAAERLHVTRTRINQLLRQRRLTGPPPTARMMARLDTPEGHASYQQRKVIIEPVFGQIKHNRGIRSLSRRGLAAADSEWKLICATHNLMKAYRALSQ